MITPISTLKRRFANFLKPTQEHFWSWMDSYWHKDENIPMNKVEGLSTALEGTASAEQLRNHLTDSQAHSGLFDRKVDKEAGKTLTSNDYTNEEKRTNQANAQKRVVGITVTGDVDKIITLTFADGTAIQAPFTDKDTLPENLADIKLNSLNFNEQTGVLTGLRSDGQQLTVSLDGRYALLGHTHPEYALRTHRHHWDNIDGIPALATEGKIQEAVRDVFQYRSVIPLSELDNITRKQGGYTIQSNGGSGAYLIFYTAGSTSTIEIFKKDWYAATRLSVRNTVDGSRFNEDNGAFRDLAWYGDIYRVGAEIGSNWTAVEQWQNGVIFVSTSLNIDLSFLKNMGNMSFRKVFAGGNVTFSCTGKQIVYTGDTSFNGGDGSTAVVSVYGNKCYIDIRNV
ncbi:hypothetical protein [Capnocytophaga granulosa]|uniref:hypothetical protein n=1 Tax=Capnocytophaga granulosa TaxID=45242 RepID=UPI0020675B05|nr:MAG TPA: hypothetical protein [Caudoviricetes sp.]